MVHTSFQLKLWFWKWCPLLSNSWSLCVFITERAMCVLVIQTSLPLSAPSFKRMTQGMCGRIIIGALLHVMLKPVEDTFGNFIENHSSFLEAGKSKKTVVLYTSQAPHALKTTRGFNLPSFPALCQVSLGLSPCMCWRCRMACSSKM